MKFESLLLRGLFVVCMMLCAATVGSMLFPPTVQSRTVATEVRLAGAHSTTLSAITPIACPLVPDGVLCLRQD
jgi:sugar (pentulose or hexulose) kinase